MSVADYVLQVTSSDAYTPIHSALLDLVISLRTISSKSLHDYLEKAIRTLYADQNGVPVDVIDDINVTSTQFKSVLAKINSKLDPLDFEIVESKDMDDSSVTLFSFVNKKPNGAILLSTRYTDNEIQYIKHIIDRIFASEHVLANSTPEIQVITYSVPLMRMIKFLRDGPTEPKTEEQTPEGDGDDGETSVAAPIIRLSLEESEEFLKDLEYSGWLERYNNNYTLSTRGLVELRKYLIETYGVFPNGTISTCFGCGDILTRGLSCPNSKCHVRFHDYCKGLVERSRNIDSCPGCDNKLELFDSF